MAITSVGSKITVKVPSIAAYYMKQIYWQQSVVVKLKAFSSNFASIPIKLPILINNATIPAPVISVTIISQGILIQYQQH